jgi:RimJ/RimL family protein N-acetyltransferase
MAARDWYLRAYGPADREKLKNFTCYTPGQRWTKTPQKMLRQCPDAIEDREQDVTVFLACQIRWDWARLRPRETGRILGAIAFGLDGEELVSQTLGVVLDRRQEGIGTALKRAALAAMIADGHEARVYSHVHKRNVAMNGLNAKLGSEFIKDPDDGDLLIHGVLAVPDPKPSTPPWHAPAELMARFARATVPGPWRPPIQE